MYNVLDAFSYLLGFDGHYSSVFKNKELQINNYTNELVNLMQQYIRVNYGIFLKSITDKDYRINTKENLEKIDNYIPEHIEKLLISLIHQI